MSHYNMYFLQKGTVMFACITTKYTEHSVIEFNLKMFAMLFLIL